MSEPEVAEAEETEIINGTTEPTTSAGNNNNTENNEQVNVGVNQTVDNNNVTTDVVVINQDNNNSSLGIMIYNKSYYNDGVRDIDCLLLFSALFASLKIPFEKIVEKSSADTRVDITNIFNKYNKITRLWIVFIGSANKYGPIASDDKCLNFQQILSYCKNLKLIFFNFFTCPYKYEGSIQHDAIDQSGAQTFSELINQSLHSQQLNEIKELQENMKSQLLDNLSDTSINYFFSALPITMVDNSTKQSSSILNYFCNRFKDSVGGIEGIEWEKTLWGIFSDLRKSKLDISLLPVCRFDKYILSGKPWGGVVIVNYSDVAGYDDQMEESVKKLYDGRRFLDFFREFGIQFHPIIVNRSAQEIMNELITIFGNNPDISNFFIVFIGSAIEYGPVAADNRCININQILEAGQKQSKFIFPLFFARPHHQQSLIQQDVVEVNETETFSVFQPNLTDNNEKYQTVRTLQENIKSQLLDNLTPYITKSANYFLTSLPLSIVDDSRKSIMDYFIAGFNIHKIGNTPLADTLEEIVSDLRRSSLDISLLPVCQCDKNIFI